jgi:hypothetical protein
VGCARGGAHRLDLVRRLALVAVGDGVLALPGDGLSGGERRAAPQATGATRRPPVRERAGEVAFLLFVFLYSERIAFGLGKVRSSGATVLA